MAVVTNRNTLFGRAGLTGQNSYADSPGIGARDYAALMILCGLVANAEKPEAVGQRGRETTRQMSELVNLAFMYADAWVTATGVLPA